MIVYIYEFAGIGYLIERCRIDMESDNRGIHKLAE